MIVRLYAILTAIAGWIENVRVALLVRVWGIANDQKSPVDWREREKLPSSRDWPPVKYKDGRPVSSIWLVGAVKAGPMRRVPTPPDFYEEKL